MLRDLPTVTRLGRWRDPGPWCGSGGGGESAFPTQSQTGALNVIFIYSHTQPSTPRSAQKSYTLEVTSRTDACDRRGIRARISQEACPAQAPSPAARVIRDKMTNSKPISRVLSTWCQNSLILSFSSRPYERNILVILIPPLCVCGGGRGWASLKKRARARWAGGKRRRGEVRNWEAISTVTRRRSSPSRRVAAGFFLFLITQFRLM